MGSLKIFASYSEILFWNIWDVWPVWWGKLRTSLELTAKYIGNTSNNSRAFSLFSYLSTQLKMVNNTERVGRESLASRDLGAGDLLLVAPPVVLGPGRQEVAVCLGCLQAVPGLAPCSSCSWPVCSSLCSSSPHHSQVWHISPPLITGPLLPGVPATQGCRRKMQNKKFHRKNNCFGFYNSIKAVDERSQKQWNLTQYNLWWKWWKCHKVYQKNQKRSWRKRHKRSNCLFKEKFNSVRIRMSSCVWSSFKSAA